VIARLVDIGGIDDHQCLEFLFIMIKHRMYLIEYNIHDYNNLYLQNTIQKTKDRTTRTPLETDGVNSCAPVRLAVPAPHVTPIVLLLNDMNIT